MPKVKAGADNPFVPKHKFDSYIVPAQLMFEIYEHLENIQQCGAESTLSLQYKLKQFAQENSL